MLAAESGMSFLRFHLAGVSLPYGTSPADYWQCVSDYVQSNLTDTLNVGLAGVSITDQQIAIPAGSGYIELTAATPASHTITKVND